MGYNSLYRRHLSLFLIPFIWSLPHLPECTLWFEIERNLLHVCSNYKSSVSVGKINHRIMEIKLILKVWITVITFYHHCRYGNANNFFLFNRAIIIAWDVLAREQ